MEKGWRRKGKNKSRASKKVNRAAARDFGKSRDSAKCRWEFPQGMSRNGTPSRADATLFLGLPRKRIVSSKLEIPYNGHFPALCWLSSTVGRPEGSADWHRPPALFLRVTHHPKESPRIGQPEPPRAPWFYPDGITAPLPPRPKLYLSRGSWRPAQKRPPVMPRAGASEERSFLFYREFDVPPRVSLLAATDGTVTVLSSRASMPVCAGISTSLPFRATT